MSASSAKDISATVSHTSSKFLLETGSANMPRLNASAKSVWPDMQGLNRNEMEVVDDFPNPQSNHADINHRSSLIINSFRTIKNGAKSKGDKYVSGESFYIQSAEYTERICGQYLESLGVILARIKQISEIHFLTEQGHYNDDITADIIYESIRSYLGPYGELLEWRNEISKIRHSPNLDGIFSFIYEAPTGFLDCFEEFCLSMPESVNQCVQFYKDEHDILKAIPFLRKVDINMEALGYELSELLDCSIKPKTSHEVSGSDEVAKAQIIAAGQNNFHSRDFQSYRDEFGCLKDEQSRQIVEGKEPGWQHKLFAIELKNRVRQIKEMGVHPGLTENQECYPYIEATEQAVSVCKSMLSSLRKLINELKANAYKLDTLVRLNGFSDHVAIGIIDRCIKVYLRPYLDIRLWMIDVSRIKCNPRFEHVFQLLHEAPQPILESCEKFYLELYDSLSGQITKYLDEISQDKNLFYFKIEEFNAAIIHEELSRLSDGSANNSKAQGVSNNDCQGGDNSTGGSSIEGHQRSSRLTYEASRLISRSSLTTAEKWRGLFRPSKPHLSSDYKEEYSQSTDSELVTVRNSNPRKHAFTIPKPSTSPKAQGLQLDLAKISAIEAESNRVSYLLNTIFVDESENSSVQTHRSSDVESAQHSSGIWGLSQEFSDFLRLIATRPEWSRTELEELAKTHSLMLDGALEHINEAALDRYDLPLTEGDDPVEINQELIKEFT